MSYDENSSLQNKITHFYLYYMELKMISFDARKWLNKLKRFIETDIQIIYFTEKDNTYKRILNESIKNNKLVKIEINKIILESPTSLKESQSKAWEIKQQNNNKNPLNDLINKQIINIYNDFSGLTNEEQKKIIKYVKNKTCHVIIHNQISKKENELSKKVQLRLIRLHSKKSN